MSLKLHKSGLGWLLLYDEPQLPTLTAWPIFHRDELAWLAKAPRDLWEAVIQAKDVFPGARVVEYIDPAANRRRFERRLKRQGDWGRWVRHAHGTPGMVPDPDDDSTEP